MGTEYYDENHERRLRKFKYPFFQRLLFLVPVALVVGAILVFTVDRIELLFRARVYLQTHPRHASAALGAAILLSLWCLWISLRSSVAYIIVTHSSIKHHFVGHGRQRISWEHLTEVEYKRRLLGHTLILHGSDGATVLFRSSIRRYDDLIALIHKNAPLPVQAQLEHLLREEEDEDEESEEENKEQDAPEDEDEATEK
jgi:hypothetical protein